MLINNVKEYRLRAGLSQFELSMRAKVFQSTLSAVEGGRLLAGDKVRKALARTLKVSVSELFPEQEVNNNGK